MDCMTKDSVQTSTHFKDHWYFIRVASTLLMVKADKITTDKMQMSACT